MSGPAKTVYWSIGKANQRVTVSSTSVSVYRGSTATFTVSYLGDGALTAVSSNTAVATVSVSGNVVTVRGVASGGAGITISVAESARYLAGSASVTANVTNVETIAIPAQSGTLTYTGSALTPTWSNYDSSKMTIGGTTSATNAGTYTAKFTLASGYQWSDGTTTAKNVAWVVNKASPNVSVSPSVISVVAGGTQTLTVSRSGSGTITAASSSTSVATVSVSGTTVTVTGVSAGSVTVTVSVAATANYTAGSATASGTVGSKPSANLTLSPTSFSLTPGETATITASRNGNGTIAAISSDTSIATVSVSGTTITVRGVAQGNTTITVYVAETSSYAGGNATVSGTVTTGNMATVTITNVGYTTERFPIYAYAPDSISGTALTSESGAMLSYSSITIQVPVGFTLLIHTKGTITQYQSCTPLWSFRTAYPVYADSGITTSGLYGVLIPNKTATILVNIPY